MAKRATEGVHGGSVARLTVAVTGPTGQLGRPAIRALERDRREARILGMAGRPFDPASMGWRKTEYRRGGVTDHTSLQQRKRDAFMQLASPDSPHRI